MSAADDAIGMRRLCSACVRDTYLVAEIARIGVTARCYYCEQEGPTISLASLADRIEKVFEVYYTRTASRPDIFEAEDPEADSAWEREGDTTAEVIRLICQVDKTTAVDAQKVLAARRLSYDGMEEETEFAEEARYQPQQILSGSIPFKWLDFARSLKTESRLFNANAKETLDFIFADLHEYTTGTRSQSVIRAAGPGTELSGFFRARFFPPDDDALKNALIYPDREIGPPPSRLATAGRMNSRGIAVFYGATRPVAAIAEVRPPIGGRVVVARFDLLRPISLLDIDALRNLNIRGSSFDPTYKERLERADFLGHISNLITLPVMPGDETLDYVITQAIAEYIANQDIDGMLYRSVQVNDGSVNVVLFHKAARVESLPIEQGKQVTVSCGDETGDGIEEDYTVHERFGPENGWSSPSDAMLMSVEPFDSRRPTLSIDLSSLQVHEVRAVAYQTMKRAVTRHRFGSGLPIPF
jgi:hypothetical protein